MLCYGLAMPFVGHVIERWGTRAVVLIGAVLIDVAIGWCVVARSPATFLLSFGVLLSLGLAFLSQVAFAPIVALLLGVSAITVPWETLIVSVIVYILIPVAIAQALRRGLLRRGQRAFDTAVSTVAPYSMSALLATLVLLFAFQGEVLLAEPRVIALLAVPIVVQVLLNAGLAYLANRKLGVAHCVAGPSCLIAASNFFELAVATAIGIFGLRSGAALATVVGVLVEVPLMLLVVRIVNSTKGWYEATSQRTR